MVLKKCQLNIYIHIYMVSLSVVKISKLVLSAHHQSTRHQSTIIPPSTTIIPHWASITESKKCRTNLISLLLAVRSHSCFYLTWSTLHLECRWHRKLIWPWRRAGWKYACLESRSKCQTPIGTACRSGIRVSRPQYASRWAEVDDISEVSHHELGVQDGAAEGLSRSRDWLFSRARSRRI